MAAKSKFQPKKRLICPIDLDTMDDIYEFKYELSEAIDEVIKSIVGLKSVVDVWMPLAFNDHLTKKLLDEQDSCPLSF